LVAAAALLLVVAVATLLRSSATDVKTTATEPTSVAEPSTTVTIPPPPDTTSTTATAAVVSAPLDTSKPKPSSTVPRSTTTRPGGTTLSSRGVGPLRIGMTTQQATATGAVGPYDDFSGSGSCGSAAPAGSYRPGDFSALFLKGRLARFYVPAGSRLRTPQGIGVGSPSSKLSSVPGTRVESPHPYGGGTNVTITSGNVGYQFTVDKVDKGTVKEWSVGTKEGLSLPEACA